MDEFDDRDADAGRIDGDGFRCGGGLEGIGFEGGVGVEDGFGDGEVREVEREAFGVAEVEAGDGAVGVAGVVEFAGEFEDAFEDDEGGVVGALAEVESEEEVVAVGAEGWA